MQSLFSAPFAVDTLASVPGTVGDVTVSGATATSLSVNFTAAYGNGEMISGYRVYLCDAQGENRVKSLNADIARQCCDCQSSARGVGALIAM